MSMVRRPPPSALKLHQGPMPPRCYPKHTLPSRPCPALALPRLMSVKDNFLAIVTHNLVLPDPHLSVTEKHVSIPRLRGPWDRSRSFEESPVDIRGLVRLPEPVICAPLPVGDIYC